ncbi:MAG: pilus assembly protein TadG-related protein [Actinomycetota bacterium]|nr:pilus assembly protein TadG-related protein [Actinomycetota bacterium]
MTRGGAAERGQVMLLVVGLCLVSFMVAGVAVDGTRLFLMRRSLQNAVDAAAIAAAGEVDVKALYATEGSAMRVDPQAARTRAVAVLQQRGVSGRVEIAVDRNVVLTRLQTHVDASFLRLVGVEQLRVAAEAAAEPVAGER